MAGASRPRAARAAVDVRASSRARRATSCEKVSPACGRRYAPESRGLAGRGPARVVSEKRGSERAVRNTVPLAGIEAAGDDDLQRSFGIAGPRDAGFLDTAPSAIIPAGTERVPNIAPLARGTAQQEEPGLALHAARLAGDAQLVKGAKPRVRGGHGDVRGGTEGGPALHGAGDGGAGEMRHRVPTVAAGQEAPLAGGEAAGLGNREGECGFVGMDPNEERLILRGHQGRLRLIDERANRGSGGVKREVAPVRRNRGTGGARAAVADAENASTQSHATSRIRSGRCMAIRGCIVASGYQ